MLQPFVTPPYSPDLSPPGYFLFPKFKLKLKGLHFADVAEIQEAVTDSLKRNFRQIFRNCTTQQKPVYMPMGLILDLKRHVSSSFVFDLKKTVLKLLDRTVYVRYETPCV
jgi:hypothetical protein